MMNDFEKMADDMLGKAQIAAAVFQQLDQKETDRIVERVFHAGFNARIKLAKMAHEETGMGIYEDKLTKHKVKVLGVCRDIKHAKTVGVIERDEARGLTKYATIRVIY